MKRLVASRAAHIHLCALGHEILCHREMTLLARGVNRLPARVTAGMHKLRILDDEQLRDLDVSIEACGVDWLLAVGLGASVQIGSIVE